MRAICGLTVAFFFVFVYALRVSVLGLDDVDHLGLGGALWFAGTVFQSRVPTWHSRRCVTETLFRVCGGGWCS